MNIQRFCQSFAFGQVKSVTQMFGGLMHKMFKVETEKGIYCVKVLNPEVMSREFRSVRIGF